ncbi:5-dehydro-4-deoxy-D-glucuronate isomerase, partial [Bacillus sp. B-TM1]
ETRYTHSPMDIRHYSTDQLRQEFLVERNFAPGEVILTYTHNDRMIFGGVMPTDKPLSIELSTELGVSYFLERRELGVINIGGPGSIIIDGTEESMKKQDGYYIGKETREVVFKSDDQSNPAKFYCVSVPAHHKYRNVRISIDEIKPMETGDSATLNKRKI